MPYRKTSLLVAATLATAVTTLGIHEGSDTQDIESV